MLKEGEIIHAVSKAGLQGAITGLASGSLYGFSTQVARGGRLMNIVLFTGLLGAGSSVVSDLVHKIAHKEIHLSKKADDQAATVLGVGASALIYLLAMRMVEPTSAEEMGLGRLLVVGGGSEYGASMLSNIICNK